jgi:hypothetical protein
VKAKAEGRRKKEETRVFYGLPLCGKQRWYQYIPGVINGPTLAALWKMEVPLLVTRRTPL